MPSKRVIATFIIALFFHCLLAQSPYTESVHLKNGTVVKGIIVEQIPNVSLKIKTKDGSLFVFKFEEIEKITKEAPKRTVSVPQDSETPKTAFTRGEKTRFEYTKTGLWFNPRFGVAIPAGFTLGLLGGYQANKWWAIGLGASFDQYIDFQDAIVQDDNPNSNDLIRGHQTCTLLPIYVENRIYFAHHRASPYVLLDIGYAPLLESNRAMTTQNAYSYSPQVSYSTISSGGIMGNIGGGIRMAASNKLAFTLDFGFLFQSYTSKVETEDQFATNPTLTTSYPFKLTAFPTLKCGVLF